jgi:D-alanyl-D-alanine carboxypeptidase
MRKALIAFLLLVVSCSGTDVARHRASRSQRPASMEVQPTSTPSPQPTVVFAIDPIGADLRSILVGRNWHSGCPVPIKDLRVLTVTYWGFDGSSHQGPLIVNERVADDVLWVFRRLYRHRFPIKRIAIPHRWREPTRADYFSTSDVTGAFNCRPVTEGTTLSQHSWGWAIDINPLQNPYVRSDGTVLSKPAKAYLDRSQHMQGMIHPADIVVRSFARIGWGWGGDWTTLKDYMHFSLTGR